METEWVGSTSLAADHGSDSRLDLGSDLRLATASTSRFGVGLAKRLSLDLVSLFSAAGGGVRRVWFSTLELSVGFGSWRIMSEMIDPLWSELSAESHEMHFEIYLPGIIDGNGLRDIPQTSHAIL